MSDVSTRGIVNKMDDDDKHNNNVDRTVPIGLKPTAIATSTASTT